MLANFVLQQKDPQKLKDNQVIINNLKGGLRDRLRIKKTSSIVAKDIFCALVAFDMIGSSSRVAQVIGVYRRNIKRVVEN